MSNRNQESHRHSSPGTRSNITRRSFLKRSGAAAAATGMTAATAAATLGQDGTPSPVATPQASPAAMDHGVHEEEQRAVQFFSPHEAVTVEALTARIFPGNADDPGAREAGVVYFIDRALSGTNFGYTLKTYTQGPFPFSSEEETAVERTSATDLYRAVPLGADTASRYGYQSILTPQDIYRRGLRFVDAYTQSEFESDFVDLSEADQDTVVAALADDSATGFEGPTPRALFMTLRNDTIAGMFSDPMYGGNQDMAGWKLIGYPGAQRFYTADDIVNPDFHREPQSLAQLMANEGH